MVGPFSQKSQRKNNITTIPTRNIKMPAKSSKRKRSRSSNSPTQPKAPKKAKSTSATKSGDVTGREAAKPQKSHRKSTLVVSEGSSDAGEIMDPVSSVVGKYWTAEDEGLLQQTSQPERQAWMLAKYMYDIDLPDLIPEPVRPYQEWEKGPNTLSTEFLRHFVKVMKFDVFIAYGTFPMFLKKHNLIIFQRAIKQVASLRLKWAVEVKGKVLPRNNYIIKPLRASNLNHVHLFTKQFKFIAKDLGQASDDEIQGKIVELLEEHSEPFKAKNFLLNGLTAEKAQHSQKEPDVLYITLGDLKTLARCWDEFLETPEGLEDYEDSF